MLRQHSLLKYVYMLGLSMIGLSVLVVSALAQDEIPANDVVWPEQYYAPYMDMGRYPTINLTKTAETTGIKYFTLAFVLTGHKNCKAAWYGVSNLKNPFLLLVVILTTLLSLEEGEKSLFYSMNFLNQMNIQ